MNLNSRLKRAQIYLGRVALQLQEVSQWYRNHAWQKAVEHGQFDMDAASIADALRDVRRARAAVREVQATAEIDEALVEGRKVP